MATHRIVHASAVLCTVAAIPAAAQDVPGTCAVAHPDPAAFIAALEAEGLTALPADAPLPDAVVDRLAWIGVAEYLMTDTGGQSAADLLPGQRMAAANIVKLKPLPTATTRVLAGDAVTLLASWRVNPLGEAEQQCRLALDLDVPPEPTAGRHGDLESGAAETADGTLTTLTFRPNRLDLGADAPHLVIDQTLRFPQERDP